MRFELTQTKLRLIIQTLEDVGHSRAGMSQAPHIIQKEDTEEWKLAQTLKKSGVKHENQSSRSHEPTT